MTSPQLAADQARFCRRLRLRVRTAGTFAARRRGSAIRRHRSKHPRRRPRASGQRGRATGSPGGRDDTTTVSQSARADRSSPVGATACGSDASGDGDFQVCAIIHGGDAKVCLRARSQLSVLSATRLLVCARPEMTLPRPGDRRLVLRTGAQACLVGGANRFSRDELDVDDDCIMQATAICAACSWA